MSFGADRWNMFGRRVCELLGWGWRVWCCLLAGVLLFLRQISTLVSRQCGTADMEQCNNQENLKGTHYNRTCFTLQQQNLTITKPSH